MRRLRVYYLSQKYKKHGQLSKVSRDAAHTLARTTVGYVNNQSTKHIHEHAVEAGILRARSLAGPVVLVNNNVQLAAQKLGSDELTAEKVLRGEQDVFFASCKDFYNRPGGDPNTPCSKPWMCFPCANAIVTRHVLPRVLAFRDFTVQQRQELTMKDWSEKFGKAWNYIVNDVLPKFSSDAIAEAERQVRSEIFYIPLALKV